MNIIKYSYTYFQNRDNYVVKKNVKYVLIEALLVFKVKHLMVS